MNFDVLPWRRSDPLYLLPAHPILSLLLSSPLSTPPSHTSTPRDNCKIENLHRAAQEAKAELDFIIKEQQELESSDMGAEGTGE